MSAVGNIIQYFSTLYDKKPLPIAGGLICGAAAIEAVVRAAQNIISIKGLREAEETVHKEKAELIAHEQKLELELHANVGKAFFYGLCAANIVPASPFIGATILICTALFSKAIEHLAEHAEVKDEFFAAKVVRLPYSLGMKLVQVPVGLTYTAGGKMISIFLNLTRVLKYDAPVPHPSWFGVAALIPAMWFRQQVQYGLVKAACLSHRFFMAIQ